MRAILMQAPATMPTLLAGVQARAGAPSAGAECVAARRDCARSAPFGAAPLASFLFTMSNSAVSSFPRRACAFGFVLPWHLTPNPFVPTPTEGQAERREAHCLELVALVSARRHACETWAVPRNRDAASRRSTVALSAQGPLPSPALPPAPVRRLHAAGQFLPGRGPGRLVSAVTGRGRRHSPLRHQDRLRRRPLDERGWD
jgi:hypothetical protein